MTFSFSKSVRGHIRLKVVSSPDELSKTAAEVVINYLSSVLDKKNHVVLIPSAGGTPLALYQLLASRYRHAIPWNRVIVIQMDDYATFDPNHPQSLAWFLKTELIGPLGIRDVHFLYDYRNSLATYEQVIADAGGVDLFIHGIGENGHLGFNEPGSSFDSGIRTVTLSESTRQANGRFFRALEEVPTHGLTLGLKTIYSARMNLVLAFGNRKRTAITRMLFEPASIDLPASCLQNHPNTLVLVDETAIKLLA